MIKKYWKLIIGGFVILFLVVSTYKACRLYDEKSIWKGRTEQWETQYKALEKTSTTEIGRLTNVIKEQTVEIQNILNQPIPELEENKTLKQELKKLQVINNTLIDSPAIIKNLKKQNEIKDNLIGNLEFTITQKDTQLIQLNLSWEKKYEAQLNISNNYKALWEETLKGNELEKNLVKSLEKDLKQIRFMSNVKSGVVIGLAAVVIYGLVK